MSDTTLYPANLPNGLNRNARSTALAAIIPTVVFGLALLWRTPSLLLHPRFWAEEGGVYYGNLQNMSPLKGLVKVFNGNYQLLTNVSVELALRVPVRYAPTVTTMISLVLALICAWMVGRVLLVRGCSLLAASAGCAMFALQPAGYEVFLTATNIQWVTSVIGLMLCLWDEMPATSLQAVICYVALAICGLTGTTTCILLPLFVIGAIYRESKFGWIMVVVLSAVTMLQAYIVLEHRSEMQRVFAISDRALMPLILQVIFSQFIPGDAINIIGAALKAQTGMAAVRGLQWVMIGLGGMAVLTYTASKLVGVFTAGILAAGAVAISLVNEFGAQGTADQMMSASAGGRYFFIGASSFVCLLAVGGQSTSSIGRVCGWTMIVLVLTNGALTAMYADWPLGNVTGPSFSEQVDACEGTPICKVKVWPDFYRPYLLIQHAH